MSGWSLYSRSTVLAQRCMAVLNSAQQKNGWCTEVLNSAFFETHDWMLSYRSSVFYFASITNIQPVSLNGARQSLAVKRIKWQYTDPSKIGSLANSIPSAGNERIRRKRAFRHNAGRSSKTSLPPRPVSQLLNSRLLFAIMFESMFTACYLHFANQNQKCIEVALQNSFWIWRCLD